jgi:eukaryotic-like serine/threonine-protein kinase
MMAVPATQRASHPDDVLPGTRAGDCVIERFLAAGGGGDVYVASHRSTGRRVAVKILRAAMARYPREVARFAREVEVVSLLRHPNIVEVFEAGALANDRPFYVMEYLEGMNALDLLRERLWLPLEEALEIVEPVCLALQAAHAAGIVHRDIKPSNIFLTADETRRVKLLDFGIAKLLSSSQLGASGLSTAGVALGTPSAMAPEQILCREVDARTDIYALGVLLYRMLTGQLPFQGKDSLDLMRRHLEEPPPRPSRYSPITPELDAVVLRCLEKQPDRRFDSVDDLVVALREAAGRPRRAAPRDVEVTGFGLHVRLRIDFDGDLIDAALADDIARTLDFIEARLARTGFLIAFATESEILAVRPLPDDPGAPPRARLAALEAAAGLHGEVSARPDADPRLHATVCVHIDQVTLREPLRTEVVGGSLVDADAWIPRAEVLDLCATQAVLPWVSGFEVRPGPDALVRLTRDGASAG